MIWICEVIKMQQVIEEYGISLVLMLLGIAVIKVMCSIFYLF